MSPDLQRNLAAAAIVADCCGIADHGSCRWLLLRQSGRAQNTSYGQAPAQPAKGGIPQREPTVLLRLVMGPELVLETSQSLQLQGVGSQLAAGRHQLRVAGDRVQISGVSLATPLVIAAATTPRKLTIAGRLMPTASLSVHVDDGQVQVVQSLLLEQYLVVFWRERSQRILAVGGA